MKYVCRECKESLAEGLQRMRVQCGKCRATNMIEVPKEIPGLNKFALSEVIYHALFFGILFLFVVLGLAILTVRIGLPPLR